MKNSNPAERELTEEYCLTYVNAFREDSKDAKQPRMLLNRDNYAMYQLEHDFTHKAKGQSREVLSKTRSAVEDSKSFFQQALSDLDDWFRVTARDGSDGSQALIRPEEMQKMLSYMLKQADYFSHVGFSVQSGLLGSLAISTVGGELIPKPKFKTKAEGRGRSYKKHVVVSDDKTWELRYANVRQEDYYPDPTGGKIGKLIAGMVDLHVIKQLAEGDAAIYDKDAVSELKPWGDADLQDAKKARETGQNIVHVSMRPRVLIEEFWGTIVDATTGDILAENIVVTTANRMKVIRKPTPNPLWHQKDPIVAAALVEFANSVWGTAMMDAGTKHNRSLIEIFNLMLDGAMKSVWGINQIRTDVLADPRQITDSIPWGTNLRINSALPPGAKVMESVISGNVPPEALNMYNLLNQELLTSMKTNDLRMGAQSMRAVKATEVVASENAITSAFQGIAKNFEEKKIQPELELGAATIAQNWDLIDKDVFVSLFGADRGEVLSQLEPQEVFVNTVNGMRFEVFGISLTMRRQADFRKWTTLLQTIGSSQTLIEAFLQKYSFEKLLGEIMTAIDLNKTKIEQDKTPRGAGPPPQPNAMQQPGGAPGASPNQMSQIPQAPGQPTGAQNAQNALSAVFRPNGGQ